MWRSRSENPPAQLAAWTRSTIARHQALSSTLFVDEPLHQHLGQIVFCRQSRFVTSGVAYKPPVWQSLQAPSTSSPGCLNFKPVGESCSSSLPLP
jgi:hypothetical protein